MKEHEFLCKKFMICQNTVISYITGRKEFTKDELMNKILENGGVFRPTIGKSLDEYMDDFVEKGIINYSPAERKYTVLVKFG